MERWGMRRWGCLDAQNITTKDSTPCLGEAGSSATAWRLQPTVRFGRVAGQTGEEIDGETILKIHTANDIQ